MRYWAGVTDNRWYEYLAASRPDEVNFWQPSGKQPWLGLAPGTPFLFKLKSPNHHVAGGGFFVRFVVLPLSLVWEAFGPKNGAPTFERFRELVRPKLADPLARDPGIGCNILAEPFFLPRELWVAQPDAFSRVIVTGRSYDLAQADGQALWRRLNASTEAMADAGHLREPLAARFGAERIVRPRLGQGGFRVEVTEAYRRRCSMTGESTLPVLDAAHIRPFSEEGTHEVGNGLLLRKDFHKLFDLGYLTIDPDQRIVVSPRIRREFFNGKRYYELHGKPLVVVPDDAGQHPRRDLLAWHNEHVFQG